jgi:uncharacterized oligopeptide transporter (OPT) family protein
VPAATHQPQPNAETPGELPAIYATLEPAPPAPASVQFTPRAVLTGMVMGGVLSTCNIYLGLQLGIGINMAVVAILLGYGFWTGISWLSRGQVRPWGMLENNISQTACSSAALVGSAGLVAAVPALTILTGTSLPWHALAVWILSVCLVGIMVAVVLRRQLLLRDNLRFPMGTACAEMLREMHTRGREAVLRVVALLAGAAAAVAASLAASFGLIKPLSPPMSIQGIRSTLLTFTVQPSLLYFGVGGLIGFRAGVSLLVGAVLAYAVIVPPLIKNDSIRPTLTATAPALPPGIDLQTLAAGRAQYDLNTRRFQWRGVMSVEQRDALLAASSDPGWQQAVSGTYTRSQPQNAAPSFSDLVQWLVWPGATIMVVSSLASFAVSLRSTWRARKQVRRPAERVTTGDDVSRPWAVLGLLVVLIISVLLQITLFGIAWWLAACGVLLAFVLAVIATRVSAETGITPVGQMGKLAQLSIGALAPPNVVANLMASNVAAGAASQSADLMDDLKCGHLVGTPARLQALAQVCGAFAGALVGSAVYLLLLHHPQEQFGRDYPLPAIAPLRAVADLFRLGFEMIPPGTGVAMLIAALAGLVLTALEKGLPARAARFVPSGASIGLAFVIPAGYSLALFAGGLAALVLSKTAPGWTRRFLVATGAGIVAGDALYSAGEALVKANAGEALLKALKALVP